MNKIVVTGANGFIGQHLCRMMIKRGERVAACIRESVDPTLFGDIADSLAICRVSGVNDFNKAFGAFEGADAVIHLAGRAHVMRETHNKPLGEFQRINVEGTRSAVQAALQSGVRRFIYLSSIKVNGEETEKDPFTADDPPGFVDPYGRSKWEAEECLKELTSESNMEWVIVRPPLVYGPGVRGNFLSLLNLANRGIPLPLNGIENKRSLVSVYNLCDLLSVVANHPAAANQRFLVADVEDLSTPDLFRAVANGLGRPPRLVNVPPALLLAVGHLFGKQNVVQRLCSSLVLDRQKASVLLNWDAPLSFEDGLRRTTEWFLRSRGQQ